MLRPQHELTVVQFSCDSCDVAGSAELLNLHCYDVPGFVQISVDGIVSWCGDCDAVVLAEHIPDLDWYSHHPDGFSDSYLDAVAEFIRIRSSAPKCLSCGTSTFSSIDSLEPGCELAKHRDCGGSILCDGVAGAVHVFGEGGRYDIEGNAQTELA